MSTCCQSTRSTPACLRASFAAMPSGVIRATSCFTKSRQVPMWVVHVGSIGKAEVFQLVVQRATADAEHPGRLGSVAFAPSQRVEDGPPFCILDLGIQVVRGLLGAGWLGCPQTVAIGLGHELDRAGLLAFHVG